MNTRPFERMVLPNGVRLLLIPIPGVASVATCVMVGVGSRYESKEINGVSHFLEHMVFKGTKKYPTPDDVSIIERQGGLQNAYTDIDITNYHNKALSTDWKLALEVNKELAIHPRLEQKHVDKERDVILEEMKRYEDEPANKVGEVFHAMMYPSSRLGMRIIGEEKSLKAADAKTLRTYHDTWYQPDNMVVVVGGQLTKNVQKDIKNQVALWFGHLKGKTPKAEDHVVAAQKSSKLEVITKPDAQQAHLTIGVHTFARTSSDRFAWNIFNLIMGVGFTSRLFKEIREKKGLCYHIRSSSDNWSDVGYWSIYAGVATQKVEEATKGVMTELSKAVQKGVTADEVGVAKKRIKTLLSFKSEDPEFFTEFYGRQEVFNEPAMTLDEYIAKIDGVTRQQVEGLIQKYLGESFFNMAVVWNKPQEERLERLLTL